MASQDMCLVFLSGKVLSLSSGNIKSALALENKKKVSYQTFQIILYLFFKNIFKYLMKVSRNIRIRLERFGSKFPKF